MIAPISISVPSLSSVKETLMSTQTYLDDPDSREWVLTVHAKCLSPENQALVRSSCSAIILYGSEDAPERIEIYGTNTPIIGEAPLFVLVLDDNSNLNLAEKGFYVSPSTDGY
jgi:hypothetical protein